MMPSVHVCLWTLVPQDAHKATNSNVYLKEINSWNTISTTRLNVSFTVKPYPCHIKSSQSYDKLQCNCTHVCIHQLLAHQVCLPVPWWAKVQVSYFRQRGLSLFNVCVHENIIAFYFNVHWLFHFATDGAMELSFTRFSL